MGRGDPTFLGKIKNAWDNIFSLNAELIFILCGSVSSWIEENILSSTGFVGRISFVLTLRQEGCQIDYLIQTRFNTIYVCEIKFRKNLISVKVIKEIEEKIKRLKVPKYMSVRPVLIHVNDVTDDLLDARYFAEILDFSNLLIK